MADTTSIHKLQYEITTVAETGITFTIPEVREDVTAENASDVINEIIALDVLGDEAGNLAAVAESCTMITTTSKTMF